MCKKQLEGTDAAQARNVLRVQIGHSHSHHELHHSSSQSFLEKVSRDGIVETDKHPLLNKHQKEFAK